MDRGRQSHILSSTGDEWGWKVEAHSKIILMKILRNPTSFSHFFTLMAKMEQHILMNLDCIHKSLMLISIGGE